MAEVPQSASELGFISSESTKALPHFKYQDQSGQVLSKNKGRLYLEKEFKESVSTKKGIQDFTQCDCVILMQALM